MSMLSNILLILGGITALIGAIGCFKFKDFLSRTHAASLIITALIINSGLSLYSLKLFLILVFLYITGSTAIHALSQAFLKYGSAKGERK